MTESNSMPCFFVGIDWGAAEHRVVVTDGAGKVVHDWRFKHQGEAIGALVAKLVALNDGVASRSRVAIEIKNGPVVEALLEQGVRVYAVNPLQTDRFRDRFMPSGAKDDRRDALVLASAVRTDAEHLALLSPTDRRTVTLRALVRLHHELVDERMRLCARLREQLWRYYAQMLELSNGDLDTMWLWALWEKAPTPMDILKLKRVVVARILKDHRVRRVDVDAVLTTLNKPSLVSADGVAEAAVAHIRSLVPRLRLVVSQLRDVDHGIEQQLERWSQLDEGSAASALNDEDPSSRREQRDEVILQSLPGVGPITLATLLTEVREPLERRDYSALRALLGVAPITRQSGKSKVVMMRRACSAHLRDAAFNWARAAVRCDPASRAHYASLVARGKKSAHAYRAVIDRLLRIACAMLHTQTEYEVRLAA